MARSKPPITPLHALSPDVLSDTFAVLVERTRSQTRDGKPFYTCRFRDKLRTVTCMIWADSPWFAACEKEWKEGTCYKLRVIYGEHSRYGPQIEIHNIREATSADREDGFDPAQLVESSRFDPAAMFAELRSLAEKEIASLPLRRLVMTILERHRDRLLILPASDRHYPFCGGWLEHVLSVTRVCIRLADLYLAHYSGSRPPLNRDLVIAGAILHDIGRVLELGDEPIQPQPTVPGRLFGHLLLGRDLVHQTAAELGDIPADVLLLLEHIIVAHLALPEWGSTRLPMIPEVLLIHHADDLDAKLETYLRCLERDVNPGPFTARDPLINKPLLKERPDLASPPSEA
ncbi:MAG: HD domain-containing protein [Gemmatales bacterium]|nr:HD domain-containing protein [Gemmatales bacterium]MDW8388426.1 HD domain-containing protein [Gemmatales bacterium]